MFKALLLLLLLSRFSRVRLCATPEMAAHQAPPSLGFSKQEHWSGLPFQNPNHYQHDTPGTTGRSGHLLPCRQGEQSHCVTQARLAGAGDGGDG